jgi:hypothetical protein
MSDDLFDDFDEIETTKASENAEVDSFSDEDPIKTEKSEEALNLPKLIGADYPQAYKETCNRILDHYKGLPELDIDLIYQELSELAVKSCPTPTLQILNHELEKVQGAKDRLSEIYIDVLRCYTFKKRAIDVLIDAWYSFSNEKSADRRKGDASYRLSGFISDYTEVDSLLKACNHILKNLDSLHDSLSRRITIIQLQLKLHDFSRNGLPDFNFDKSYDMEKSNGILDEKDLLNHEEELKPDQSIDAKEVDF